MPTAKEILQQALVAAGGLTCIKLGQTLYVFTGSQRAEMEAKLRQRAQRSGETLEIDGAQEWYEWDHDYDTARRGTDCYTWHRDGNRARATLFHCRKDKTGDFTKTAIRKGWRSFHD